MTTTERVGLGGALQTTLVGFERDGRRYLTDEGVSSEFNTGSDGVLRFEVELCQPNFELLEFICGATTPDSWTPDADGRSVEVSVWSARVKQGAVVGYYRWDATCSQGFGFRGVRLEGGELGMIRLGGSVEPDTFSLHLESDLPSLTRGFTGQETT